MIQYKKWKFRDRLRHIFVCKCGLLHGAFWRSGEMCLLFWGFALWKLERRTKIATAAGNGIFNRIILRFLLILPVECWLWVALCVGVLLLESPLLKVNKIRRRFIGLSSVQSSLVSTEKRKKAVTLPARTVCQVFTGSCYFLFLFILFPF